MSAKKVKLEQLIRESLAGSSSKSVEDTTVDELIEDDEENSSELTENEYNDADDKKKKKKKDKDMKEETEAASTLRPGARSIADPKALSQSSVGMMSGVMGAMSNMSKDEQVSFFNQVMAQYGAGKTFGVGDNSEQNKSTLDMKPSHANGQGPDVKMPMPQINAKEDVEAMFAGQELTEEFKEKATVLFEAAVNAKVIAEVAKIEEEYTNTLSEELKVFSEELVDKLDSYLDYVVENWMTENEVAIESTLRNELMEEFIGGLKNLFTEHYIDVPESKVDVLETLSNANEELETKLDKAITENIEMKKVLSEVAKNEIFEELSEGLVVSQKEKFKTLAEGIEFDGDVEVFEKKLRIIKETYFNIEKPVSSNIQEETFEGQTTINESVVDPQISKYVQALTRTIKK